MPKVFILGGGLAGLAASAALASTGYEIELFESRKFLGGRATSWPVTNSEDGSEGEIIDNCQHILLKCCTNLLDFYRRLGVESKVHFHREFNFVEPGGRMSQLKRGIFPAPFHFAESFLSLHFLNLADKLGIARAMHSLKRERNRKDLDQITMLDWLREKRQTDRAIERFWRQVLVSAISEELDRMAASHGFQVFWLGMIARPDAYEMGVPEIPLRELYDERRLRETGNVELHYRAPVTMIETNGGRVAAIHSNGVRLSADYYISCLPSEKLQPLLPTLPVEWAKFEHSPITGIHLWFDREITALPHATLLDRTIQWMYNKGDGKYLQIVVSASRSLIDMPRQEVIDLAIRELGDFFPLVKGAKLEKAQVIKEVRATFSATPGLEALRPLAVTPFNNFFLAGDWTRSGWPSTMEGAVRSGYLAAEAVTRAAGKPEHFLLPDVA